METFKSLALTEVRQINHKRNSIVSIIRYWHL